MNSPFLKCLIMLVLLSGVLSSENLKAEENNNFSFSGRNFSFVLLQNQRFTGNEERQKNYHYYLSIISEDSCRVSIYHESFKDTIWVDIVPDSIVRADIAYNLTYIKSDWVNNNVIRVSSDKNIKIYCVSSSDQSAGTYTLIPEKYWGKKYISANYFNFLDNFFSQSSFISGSKSAVFDMIPRFIGAIIFQEGSNPIRIELEKYQNFCILQDPNSNIAYVPDLPFDLSGSIIESWDSDIAMFSGHQCAQVPNGEIGCDMLAEQMLPFKLCSNSYFIPPLPGKIKSSSRVLCFEDDSQIIVNGDTVAHLDRGEFYDIREMTKPTLVESNRIIYVVQYSHGYAGKQAHGDPMMLTIPSEKIYQKKYILTKPLNEKTDDYVTIMADKNSIGNILYDGVAIPKNYYKNVENTENYFYQFKIKDGVHKLESSVPFGIYQFGYSTKKNVYKAYGNL